MNADGKTKIFALGKVYLFIIKSICIHIQIHTRRVYRGEQIHLQGKALCQKCLPWPPTPTARPFPSPYHLTYSSRTVSKGTSSTGRQTGNYNCRLFSNLPSVTLSLKAIEIVVFRKEKKWNIYV